MLQGVPIPWKNFAGKPGGFEEAPALLVTLQRRLGIEARTFLFDGGRKKPVELGSTRRRGGFRTSLELREVKL
ncbi:hypothetical protein MPNT_10334 [Candidatus Methylacidithermus pantelleriae]|uniref:Uncharacterized protein n=1 Tax=Candidatus Methylacidithermus pantelleriae TaxID=2744239 RepID=A0A8J2FV30_9BACT|nr:hypothetical protein MPNT_10334 [Candidatus Methylacidithermus pantelleriae]